MSRKKESRVLVFSDEHLPAVVNGRVKWLKNLYKEWRCNKVICLGDLTDQHAISRHTTEADAKGALDEMAEAVKMAKEYYKAFPNVTMIMGNHDLRIIRAANEARLPKNWLRPYESVIEAPKGWKIEFNSIVYDGVMYDHGEGCSGINGHRRKAITEGMNVVIGHIHSHAGVAHIARSHSLIWGMNVGCGIDSRTYHARYGRKFTFKPVVGAGIVIDGKFPHFIPMDLGNRMELKV